MKWKHRGHEFDEIASQIPKGFGRKIFIFGAGKLGKNAGMCIDALGLLGGFIDNDTKRFGEHLWGKSISSLEEYLSHNDERAIVIAVSKKNIVEIESQLLDKKLIHGKDYFLYDEFMDRILPIIATYYMDKTFMRLAQITLTERCSLKCKKHKFNGV